MVPGSRRGGDEGSSSASLLKARKDGKLERKRPRAGQPKHTREAAVVWECYKYVLYCWLLANIKMNTIGIMLK